MAQLTTSVEFKNLKLTRREQLILVEIGRDRIDTASSFVDYIEENYGLSKSSVWYCLKRLKELEVLGFASKEEQGKPLALTRQGLGELSRIESSRNEIMEEFSGSFLEKRATYSYNYGYARSGDYALGRLG